MSLLSVPIGTANQNSLGGLENVLLVPDFPAAFPDSPDFQGLPSSDTVIYSGRGRPEMCPSSYRLGGFRGDRQVRLD